MGDFRKNGGKRFSSGREGGFGDRGQRRPTFAAKSWRGEGDRDRGPALLHRATCAKCGSPCEVPFRPISGRPVYCHNCFQTQKDGGDHRAAERFPRKDYDGNKNFDKPHYKGNSGPGDNGGLKEQMEMLNIKVDRLIKAVEAMANNKLLIREEGAGKDVSAESIVSVKKARKPAKKVFKKNVRPF